MKFIVAATVTLAIAGCAVRPPQNLMQPTDDALKLRAAQSRRYETTDETALLAASAALLQDMGFSIDESNKELGVITASKTRSAVTATNMTLALIITALAKAPQPYEKDQRMRAGVVVKPLGDGKNTMVRVTFQRVVYNSNNMVTTQEMIGDNAIYIEFFDKLSKAVFLQAHDL